MHITNTEIKYLFYTNTAKDSGFQLPDGISVRKRMPKMFVDGMTEMNLGKRLFLHILSKVAVNTVKGYGRCSGNTTVSVTGWWYARQS